MTHTHTYSYAVLRYVHGRATGEALNIGVIVYAPSRGFLDAKVDRHYERLSATFRDFSAAVYRGVRRELLEGIRRQARQIAKRKLLASADARSDLEELLRHMWPDKGLSFATGPVRTGVTASASRELDRLFDRMVLSQAAKRAHSESRTDEQVWEDYQRSLPEDVVAVLQPKTISTPEVTVTFDRAFKNERWHAVQPVSLDAMQADTIQRRASNWVGLTTGLLGDSEIGEIYFLLGAPRNDMHDDAYQRAKSLLTKSPIRHHLIEENEAVSFAHELRDYMSKHGVLRDEE